MASTPEGKVKQAVSALLQSFAPHVYYQMPVPSGFGDTTLDYIACCKGRFFGVETKAMGKKPTARQGVTITRMLQAEARVFVIDRVPGPEFNDLYLWLETLTSKKK